MTLNAIYSALFNLPVFNGSRGHLIVAAVTAILGTIYFAFVYRAEKTALSLRQKAVLYCLRAAVLLIALFMITRPAFLQVETESHTPIVPFLVDDSRSMLYPDARENPLLAGAPKARRTRLDGAKAASKILANKLAATHNLCGFVFSDTLRSAGNLAPGEHGGESENSEGFESLRATGNYSNVADAVAELLEHFAERKLPGVVVFSDGRQTGGQPLADAIALARRASVPIHTVMLGSEFPLRDLCIEEVNCPPEASLSDVLSFQVNVTNQISDPLTCEAKLMEGKEVLASRTVKLARGPGSFTLRYIPEKEGVHEYRVVLPVFEDEVNSENNEVSVKVNVTKRTLKVLLIAGEPNLEYHNLVPALLRDPVVILSTFLQSADLDYTQQGKVNIKELPQTLKDWESYDVVILYDADPTKISKQQLTGLERRVAKGGGLLVIAGRTFGMGLLAQIHGATIRALLPVEIDPSLPSDHETIFEKPFHAVRTLQGRTHPVMMCESRSDVNDKIWSTFPPLYWTQTTSGVKQGAVSLLEKAPQDSSGSASRCLMAVQRYKEGVVFYSGINAFWLWRYPYGSYDYDRFWTRVIRYLGESLLAGKQNQVALSTDKRIYAPGEHAKIELTILDPALGDQLASASIYCGVKDSGGGEFLLPLARSRDGAPIYHGEYPVVVAGETTLRVKQPAPNADSEAKPLFNATLSFQVRMRSLEEIDTSGDLEAMKKLAGETGGQFYYYANLKDLDQLANAIPADKEVLSREKMIDVWDTLPCLFLFLALAASEWCLRKVWGLL